MIKIYKNTKIFVHCQAGIVTGGAELLHQLVSRINDKGREAYIVYFGEAEHAVPDEYRLYNIKVADKVEDVDTNVEVIYEGRFDLAHQNKNIQKFLWWLSVDHFFMCSILFLSFSDLIKYDYKLAIYSLIKRIGTLILRKKNTFGNNISIKYLKSLNAVHGYQSEYAQNFLQNKKFGEIVALKDYINSQHGQKSISDISVTHRENIILYNPKKGLAYTKKLIKQTPGLVWIPIANMTREELISLMQKAKLYVDFGYHPGKDRLPRECAANGCCVITGKRGSAAFFEDVAIPEQYKFEESKSSKKDIIKQIEWVLQNYDQAISDFQYYRHVIAEEKDEFEKQIDRIFLM